MFSIDLEGIKASCRSEQDLLQKWVEREWVEMQLYSAGVAYDLKNKASDCADEVALSIVSCSLDFQTFSIDAYPCLVPYA